MCVCVCVCMNVCYIYNVIYIFSRARGVHTVNAKSLLQSANWIQETGKHGMQLQV